MQQTRIAVWLAFPLVFAVAGCEEDVVDIPADTPYILQWVFVNSSTRPGDNPSQFAGEDLGNSSSVTRSVPNGNVDHGTSSGVATTGDMEVEATVIIRFAEGGASDQFKVPIARNKRTTITVTWDGTTIATTTEVDAGAMWKLENITGNTAGNWQDAFGSATGTLVFNVPKTIEEGSAYPVSATFTANVTEAPGWARRVDLSAGIIDRGVPGMSVNNIAALGVANLVVSGSVTAIGAWPVPSGATQIAIEAGGNILQGGPPGSVLNVVARYSKMTASGPIASTATSAARIRTR